VKAQRGGPDIKLFSFSLVALQPSEAEMLLGVEGGDLLDIDGEEGLLTKPRRRADCLEGLRPCPFVSCRYNLYLDVRGDGVLRINFPDREPSEMTASCALDLAADGPRTLEAVASIMGMSKERARQIEVAGLDKVKVEFPDEAD
jgi:hypothetical protein